MNKIKLIGIRGDKNYESWRTTTRQVLKDLNLQNKLEEVNKVDAIVDFQVSAVPALMINDTILLEQNNHIPDTHEIKNSILNYLNQHTQKMQNIVIPTDFSKTAHNAYLYGCDLAEYIGGQVKVMHACYPSVDSLNGINTPNIEELKAYKNDQLDAFIQNDHPTSVESVIEKNMVEKIIKIGFPKDEIIKISEAKDTDMIVMGTTGKGGVLDKIFGSVSSDVAMKAHCPIWLVPPNAQFDGIKNILYAGNYESANGRMLREVSEIAKKFEANIHMVHVSKKKSHEENKIQELVLEKLFNKIAPDLDFEMATVVSEKVWEGLDRYTSKNNIDLMVIVTRHRNFFDSIRHKSITKDMIFHTKTPLLILHLDDIAS